MTATVVMTSAALIKNKKQHCQCRIALESPLLGYLVGYVYRTFDVFCDQKRRTPLERLRDSRGGQKPSSFPFGIIGLKTWAAKFWCPPVHNGGDDADPTIAAAIGTHPNFARAASLFWHLHNHVVSPVDICH